MSQMNQAFLILLSLFLSPFLVYFCVKFGTVAYYKAKEFVEEERKKYKQ